MKGLVVVFATHFFPVSAPLHTPLRPGASLGNPPSPSSVAGPEHGGLLRVPEHYTPPLSCPPQGKPRANATAQNPCKRRKHDNKRTFMRQRRKNQVPSFLSFFFFPSQRFWWFFSSEHAPHGQDARARRETANLPKPRFR